VSPEICPDCIAEQDILKQELSEPPRDNGLNIDRISTGLSEPILLGPSSIITEPNAHLGPSSTITEPGTPASDVHENVLVGTSDDHQVISMPGAAVSGLSLDDVGSVVAADLGTMLDAIIIEHRGTLDKVITNIRDGVLGRDGMQKLSQDIAKVSEAVASMPEDQLKAPATFVRGQGPEGKHSMILDVNPTLLRQRTRSIPQLLELIDAAADDLGLSLSRSQMGGVQHESNLVGIEVALAEAPTERNPTVTTLRVPGGMSPYVLTPNPSAPNTALPTPNVSYALRTEEGNSSYFSPALSDALSPGSTRLPSELFRSQDLTPVATTQSTPVTPLPIASSEVSTPTITQGLSRIPSLKQSLERPTAPRSHQSTPAMKKQVTSITRTPSMKLAPYQRSDGKTVRAAALVKPSEVVSKQRQQQRTFEQEWLRDFSRASNRAERSGRRGRAESLGRGMAHKAGDEKRVAGGDSAER